MGAYRKSFEVTWSDCDPNGHLRGSVYADLCTHVRFAYLKAQGLPVDQLVASGVGPVVLHDETDYLKELRLGDALEIDLELQQMSADGSRWRIGHTVYRADGKVAARHLVSGGWLDLKQRRLCPPPPALLAVMQGMQHAAAFTEG